MTQRLTVSVCSKGMMRSTATAGNHIVEMDYPARPDSAGMTPLELLMASVGGCVVGGLTVLLQRASQPFTSIEVEVAAERRDEHPTILTTIDLDVRVGGAVDPAATQKALSIAETQICPVLAMLKGNTTIRARLALLNECTQLAADLRG